MASTSTSITREGYQDIIQKRTKSIRHRSTHTASSHIYESTPGTRSTSLIYWGCYCFYHELEARLSNDVGHVEAGKQGGKT